MSITPPENATPGTPLFDQTIASPTYDDLRVSPFDEPEDTTPPADDAASTAKERAAETKGAAQDAASDVAGSAKEAGAKVASTGKEQASRVAKDALGQARELYGQATSQLSEQAGTQQQKAAGTLHTFADDLAAMGGQSDGLAAQLVQTLETRARSVADWLEHREPADVVAEVRRFAAGRPGLFIALAAGAGIVAARLTKALVAEAKDDAAAPVGPAPADVR